MDYKTLTQSLADDLNKIITTNSDIVKHSNLCIVYCHQLLLKCKKAVLIHGFKNTTDEIHFFKMVKPEVLSELLYYTDLRSLHINLPKIKGKKHRQYLQRKADKVNSFFTKNVDFIRYVDNQSEFLDEFYYTRGGFKDMNYIPSKRYLFDPEFNTSHDVLLAKYISNKRFKETIEELMHPTVSLQEHTFSAIKKIDLQWTGTHKDAIELLYALKHSGAINNGNVSIRELTSFFDLVFKTRIGDPYQNYAEIKRRKKEQLKFMNKLLYNLQSRLDEDDEIAS